MLERFSDLEVEKTETYESKVLCGKNGIMNKSRLIRFLSLSVILCILHIKAIYSDEPIFPIKIPYNWLLNQLTIESLTRLRSFQNNELSCKTKLAIHILRLAIMNLNQEAVLEVGDSSYNISDEDKKEILENLYLITSISCIIKNFLNTKLVHLMTLFKKGDPRSLIQASLVNLTKTVEYQLFTDKGFKLPDLCPSKDEFEKALLKLKKHFTNFGDCGAIETTAAGYSKLIKTLRQYFPGTDFNNDDDCSCHHIPFHTRNYTLFISYERPFDLKIDLEQIKNDPKKAKRALKLIKNELFYLKIKLVEFAQFYPNLLKVALSLWQTKLIERVNNLERKCAQICNILHKPSPPPSAEDLKFLDEICPIDPDKDENKIVFYNKHSAKSKKICVNELKSNIIQLLAKYIKDFKREKKLIIENVAGICKDSNNELYTIGAQCRLSDKCMEESKDEFCGYLNICKCQSIVDYLKEHPDLKPTFIALMVKSFIKRIIPDKSSLKEGVSKELLKCINEKNNYDFSSSGNCEPQTCQEDISMGILLFSESYGEENIYRACNYFGNFRFFPFIDGNCCKCGSLDICKCKDIEANIKKLAQEKDEDICRAGETQTPIGNLSKFIEKCIEK